MNPTAKALGALIVGIIFLLISIGSIVKASRKASRDVQLLRHGQTTQGQVLRVGIKVISRREAVFVITYSYSCENSVYTHVQEASQDDFSASTKEVTVYYLPEKPHISMLKLLDPRLRLAPYIAAFSIFAALFCWWTAYMNWLLAH